MFYAYADALRAGLAKPKLKILVLEPDHLENIGIEIVLNSLNRNQYRYLAKDIFRHLKVLVKKIKLLLIYRVQ